MSFQSMWLDSNLIFLTFHGIRSHMKTFSRSLEGFGKKQHQHCWEFTILEQLHLTQLTIWNKNKKPWSFESFHLPFLGDARYNSSDAFPVLTRRKITKRRVVQSYHPKEIVPFRQLICLQHIYIYTQLLINTTEINYQAEIEKKQSCLPFFEGHHFRVRGNISGRSKAPQSSQLLEELKQSSPSFLRFLLGKHVLPFT